MTDLPLALGAMMFGTTIDEPTSFSLLDRFVEAGGVWIDTANCYAFWVSASGFGGQSEEVLGRWLARRPGMRDRVKLSTKFGAEPVDASGWPASREGLSRKAIRAAVEGSLRRLGTDHVDLLWAHVEDRSVPIEETADAMSDLVDEGFTTRVGTSNHPAWLVERGRAHVAARGGNAFSALQHSRNYLSPRPRHTYEKPIDVFSVMSDEHLDLARQNDFEIWAYTPLLSGAYDNPAKPIPEIYDHRGTTRRLAVLGDVAAELGATRGQVVLAWLVAAGIRPILGGSKLDQLDSALAGVGLQLPPEVRARLDDPE